MPTRHCIYRRILVLPISIVLAAVAIAPLIYIVYKSFFEYNMVMPWRTYFSGVDNYVRAFGSSSFWNSIRVMLDYLVRALPIQLLLGLGVALLLNQKFRGNNLTKILLATPLVLTPAVTAIIWRLMFNPQTSLINHWISGLGLSSPIWLGDRSIALWSIVLAGLAEISPQLYDAAQIDGASSFQIFRYITLPMLSSKILLIAMFRGLLILKDFDKIFILTGGGPAEATETLSLHTYYNAFWWFDIGYASALSFLYLVMVVAATTIIFRRVRL